MFYVIFIVGLLMVCVAALEFCYMMFLESVVRQHKRRIVELERENAELARQLDAMETLLDDEATETEDETWPELVDEDNRCF
jgi:Tfp pilus assembly protein PilN